MPVIGMVGSFGSGCTYIADHVLKDMGYRKISLSDILRRQDGAPALTAGRAAWQRFGDEIRRTRGAAFLAEEAAAEIRNDPKQQKWVVDSIRNPSEVRALRTAFTDFFSAGVFANEDVRWERVKKIYDGNQKQFELDDATDAGRNNEHNYGQRVSDCFVNSDVIISNSTTFDAHNDEFEELKGRVASIISKIENPRTHGEEPRPDETLMAVAYAIGQRSRCLQRKVGALVVDERGTVISSGFNEVPPKERPCKTRYRTCFRRKRRSEILDELLAPPLVSPDKREALEELMKLRLKVLDLCRSLHAEENAIVSLARNTGAAGTVGIRMFTTTFPCSLCANKIANVGLKEVVYLEPYPDQSGLEILRNQGIACVPFEGVTQRAYFRVYGDET